MVLYPDVQRRAREEIDGVVGHERLTGEHDDLLYLKALCLKLLHWREIFPLGEWICIALIAFVYD